MSSTPPQVVSSSTNPVPLTRDDVAAVAAIQRRALARFNRRGSASIIGALALNALLLAAAEHFGWPGGWMPVILFSGWGLGIAGATLAWWHHRRSLAGLQLQCAACGAPLMESRRSRHALARADLVVATGNCPSCGHAFIGEGS